MQESQQQVRGRPKYQTYQNFKGRKSNSLMNLCGKKHHSDLEIRSISLLSCYSLDVFHVYIYNVYYHICPWIFVDRVSTRNTRIHTHLHVCSGMVAGWRAHR